MASPVAHTAMGLFLATLTTNPLVYLVAIVSHLFLDTVPEWYANKVDNPTWFYASEVTMLVSLIYIWAVLHGSSLFVLGVVLASLSPDIIDTIMRRLMGKAIFPFHPKPRYTTLGFEFQTVGMTMTQTFIFDLGFCLLALMVMYL